MIANSSLGSNFQELLDFKLGSYSISLWINDGLMTFFLLGLEIKREILEGEFSSFKNAKPIFAALGGMLGTSSYFYFFNQGSKYTKTVGEFLWLQTLRFLWQSFLYWEKSSRIYQNFSDCIGNCR